MGKGARIGYWRGSIAGLIDDIQARRPSVPVLTQFLAE